VDPTRYTTQESVRTPGIDLTLILAKLGNFTAYNNSPPFLKSYASRVAQLRGFRGSN